MQVITDQDYVDFLGVQESQFIIKPSELIDEVTDRLRGEGETKGDLLPWSKTHNCIQFKKSEISIWGGFNGHGKSQILNMIVAFFIKANSKCLIASMEMKPAATMERMVRQISGTRDPSDQIIKSFMEWTDDKLWLYDQSDTVSAERIIGMIHYAASLGINHVVVDSLMKCGFKGGSDVRASQQVEFVDRLCWAAKTLNIHIHLVHHMRKGEGNKGEYTRPGKHDFRGNSELVDLVDNAFIIHRNKTKEDKINRGDMGYEDEQDATLECVKSRNGEWEGIFKLWFNKDSQQYTPDSRNKALPYLFNVN